MKVSFLKQVCWVMMSLSWGIQQGFGVPNGKPIAPGAPPILNSITRLTIPGGGHCTATRINANPPTFLTAFHCVDRFDPNGTLSYFARTAYNDGVVSKVSGKDVEIISHPKMNGVDLRKELGELGKQLERKEITKKEFREAAAKLLRHDVAVLVVKDEKAIQAEKEKMEKKRRQIKTAKYAQNCPVVKRKTKLLVAGHGAHDTSGGIDYVKPKFDHPHWRPLKYGVSQVTNIQGGLIKFFGVNKDYNSHEYPLGKDVSLGPGDSGGPTFVENADGTHAVASVASYILDAPHRNPKTQDNYVVDICNDDIQSFLKKTMRKVNRIRVGEADEKEPYWRGRPAEGIVQGNSDFRPLAPRHLDAHF